MRNLRNIVSCASLFVGTLLLLGPLNLAAQNTEQPRQTPRIHGQILDPHARAIAGAKVVIKDATGKQRSTVSDQAGGFEFPDAQPGKLSIRISASGFAPYGPVDVVLTAERDQPLSITLQIANHKDEVTVLSDNPLFRGAEYSGGSFVLSGKALESLPEGPGGLEAVLRALAVRTAGPFGPDILVNGFQDGTLPLTHSIREIRVNDNPFSAEYSKLGLGRVEILTKPGTEEAHGEVFFNFGDAALNSRNPFASNEVPYQSRLYGGNISGPIIPHKLTFFVDFNRQQVKSNAVINATTVNSAFQIAPLSQAVVTPEKRVSIGPRVDYQINAHNTLVARYSSVHSHASNFGVGEFSLPSRSQNNVIETQTVQLTETAVLSVNTINETRFQYVRDTSSRRGDNSTPVINVPGAFTGGGADIGLASDNRNRWELQNFSSFALGRHMVKAGVQLRYIDLGDGSTQNFGGTYTFNGGLAPELDANNQPVTSPDGSPVLAPITSIEAYRRTLLFRSFGLSPTAIRELGGGASQFSISTGQIDTRVRQYELGVFVQDDWRLTPRFSLHAGLRYEHQNNVSDPLDFGPRLAFAWGLGRGTEQPKTVLRGGFGVFYDRVGDNLVLRALQLNGVNQRQFFTSDASILNLFPAVPALGDLSRFTIPQSIVRFAPNLRVPYTIHSSLSLERRLPGGISLDLTYSRVRSIHVLRSRDFNAPLPGTSIRPEPNAGEVFQYESSARFNQNQLLANLVYRMGKNMTLWTTYTLSDAKSDTDGPDTFPASSYNLRNEYGRSALTARHTWYFGGWMTGPGKLEITPLVLWRSGLPFNITTGRDSSGDSLFMARPAFATNASSPNNVSTPFGTFDLNAGPGQLMIPRNFGTGPNFFIANLRISRTFPLTKRTSMILSIQAQNVLNHTNPGLPIGSLASPLFGLSNTAAGDWGQGSNQAGNRRLDLWLFFHF